MVPALSNAQTPRQRDKENVESGKVFQTKEQDQSLETDLN